ncbi:melatonin receptor type 1B-A-like [Patiria miniata]|uniref:G-protein coupled receptors family 1 profile domain-containing protein n=1 Tax=Patiria miniata TaxID=46514 RepID=A0A913ZVB8_PATMI|nr:melatonin receptor type 1B-A-like [Patiria miniata]
MIMQHTYLYDDDKSQTILEKVVYFLFVIRGPAAGMDVNHTVDPSGVTPAIALIERQVLAVVLGIIVVTGLVGNSVVILAVILSKKLRRCITNSFVLSLSVSDLAACLSMPWTIVSFLYPGNDWPLPDSLCTLGGFGLIMSVGCSIFTLSSIALNRLHLLTMPRHIYRRIYTHIQTAFMILLTWLVSIFVASVPLFSDLGRLGYSARHASCTRDSSHPLAGALNMFIALVFYPVPCLIIIISYARIYNFLRRHTRIIAVEHDASQRNRAWVRGQRGQLKGQVSHRQLVVTWNMFYVVCVFCSLVTPYGVALLIPNNGRALPYTAVVLSINSCINPFIYATKHPDFKRVMLCILSCRCDKIPGRIRRHRAQVYPLNL